MIRDVYIYIYNQTLRSSNAGRGSRAVWGSEAWTVFDRSEAVIAGSNPALGMDV
jgi:hypothetical protein